MMNRIVAFRVALTLCIVVLGANFVHAAAVSFNVSGTGTCAVGTSAGSIGTGGSAENAAVTLTPGAGTVSVSLTNCLANPKDVTQVITDLFFTVSGGSTGTVGSATASYINIDGSGVVTAGSANGQWGLCSNGGTFHLDDLGCGASGTPADGIIGPGPYTNCNGSICGNAPHNPFINQTASWTITAAGVTSSSTFSNVVISFGTLDFANSGGTPTPEPGTLLLFGSGLLGVAGIVRRKLSS